MKISVILVLSLSVSILTHAQLALSDPSQRSGKVVGQISIPSIGLEQTIREGVDMSISITDQDGVTAKYVVYETFIVEEKGVFIINPPHDPGEAIMTIFTCHPIHSHVRRWVVRARLSR